MAAAQRSAREVQIDEEIAAYEALLSPDPDDLREGLARLLGDTAAVRARVEISNLRREAARLDAARRAATERDPLKKLRILRRASEAEGSWTAAAQYARQEAEFVLQLEREKTEAERARFAHLGLGELYDVIDGALKRMPANPRRELLTWFAGRLAEDDA